jgi:hypothetical protein
MEMKKWIVFAAVWHMSLVLGWSVEQKNMEVIRDILLCCRGPEEPSLNDDLANFAKANALSDADMSNMLIVLAQDGLRDDADALHRQLTDGALWGLARFGGEEEIDFVKDVMRATQNSCLRQTAVLVGMRMNPDKWEEWVREVAADNRFDSLTRFDAYEEAYRIGRNGDEKTRQQVEKVLSEYTEKEASEGNRISMRRWTGELKER